ncbi:MAG: isopentenyl-diphosphate Delta-isomerase [Bacteroidetes bacterium]|nr:isopentenyl-diphosphate Delta-isomerase [Bacteroidota bacterium]
MLFLVDKNDIITGTREKISVHQNGLLHRAFSIFIFNEKHELLLQQRAFHKYHSGGLWSNSCCSHPVFGENIHQSIIRRLKEELAITCRTEFIFSFHYLTHFENGLIENEIDHVYMGVSRETPIPNRNEVAAWRYIKLDQLKEEISLQPEKFSYWLKACLPKLMHHINK